MGSFKHLEMDESLILKLNNVKPGGGLDSGVQEILTIMSSE